MIFRVKKQYPEAKESVIQKLNKSKKSLNAKIVTPKNKILIHLKDRKIKEFIKASNKV